jgi:PIN domain nuclease of toxin-antitoxin system
MRFLLDTHSFLWAVFEPEKLSRPAQKTIRDTANDVFVSVITFWEISLKYNLGKITLEGVGPEGLPRIAEEMRLEILSVSPNEAATFHRLPKLAHRDPFDRLIIWQAIQQKMGLISKDRSFREYQKYGLKVLW